MSDCNENQKTGKLVTPQRNRYFYGKLLDEASLRMEQSYFNQKRWMMNRLGLGCGVMCGLKVTIQGDLICISPGVAIDSLGREIVVPEAKLINPRKITDDKGVPTGEEIEAGEEGYVCLAYHECLAEEVPVLVTDCDSADGKAPSVIRESFYVLVKKGPPPSDVPNPAICAALSEQIPEEKRKNICEALSSRSCSAGDTCACVVLASISWEGDKISVSECNARSLVYSNAELFEMLMCLSSGERPSDGLTKITAINWKHDDKMTWKEFEALEAFEISFSDEVTTKPVHDQGWLLVSAEFSCDSKIVNYDVMSNIFASFYKEGSISDRNTFIFLAMMFGWIHNYMWLNSWMDDSTYVKRCDINSKDIIFSGTSIRWKHLSLINFLKLNIHLLNTIFSIVNFKVLIRVIVKCDFLTDKNGRCVDGNHLGGLLSAGNLNYKTGDGVAGGEFESWFELTELDSVINPIPMLGIDNGLFKKFDFNPEEMIFKFSNRTNQPEKGAMEDFFKDLKSLFKTGD